MDPLIPPSLSPNDPVSVIAPAGAVAKEKLDLFYQLTRTPVAPGEQIEQPCTLPLGTPPVDRAMITTAFGLEIPMPSRASVIGFLVAWGIVAALIGGFITLV